MKFTNNAQVGIFSAVAMQRPERLLGRDSGLSQRSTTQQQLETSMRRTCLILLISIFVISCAGKPSEDDARKGVEALLNSGAFTDCYSRGSAPPHFKLADFKKLNAVDKTVQGVKKYEVQFEGQIEPVCDRAILRGASFFQTSPPRGRISPGERARIEGTIVFTNTENGWEDDFTRMANRHLQNR